MTNDLLNYRRSDVRYVTPEQLRHAMRRAERMRAQAIRDLTRAVATRIARAFRRRSVVPAPAGSASTHVHPA